MHAKINTDTHTEIERDTQLLKLFYYRMCLCSVFILMMIMTLIKYDQIYDIIASIDDDVDDDVAKEDY